MKRILLSSIAVAVTALASAQSIWAGQAPGAASDPDIPVSHRDRVYAAEQFSNTVSVTDPVLRQNLHPLSGRPPMLSRQAKERLGDCRQEGRPAVRVGRAATEGRRTF